MFHFFWISHIISGADAGKSWATNSRTDKSDTSKCWMSGDDWSTFMVKFHEYSWFLVRKSVTQGSILAYTKPESR